MAQTEMTTAASAGISGADTAWMLVSCALVLLMTPGLAFFYGGLVRSKNILNTMMMSFASLGVTVLVWVLAGYSLAFAPGSESMQPWLGGLGHLFFQGVNLEANGSIPHLLFAAYQGAFAIITAALISGAVVERIRFAPYLAFICGWVLLVYAPVCHWVWGGGWLGELGALDFAGGTVVHVTAGTAAVVAAWKVGPRSDFGRQAIIPHNVPFVLLGAGLLWFGWFGFNAGSALAPNGDAVNAFVVTNTAAAAGVIAWTGTSWLFNRRPSVIGAVSGAISGLVAITPAAGFVGPIPAVVIGLVAGVVCYWAVELLGKLRIDDSLAVLGVHGIGGTWGAMATGLFVGVGYGALAEGVTRGEQILYQLISIGAAWGWSFVATGVILLAIKYTMGLRLHDRDEEIGLDASQHDEVAYSLTDD
jgi:Amt family ammonium transporter